MALDRWSQVTACAERFLSTIEKKKKGRRFAAQSLVHLLASPRYTLFLLLYGQNRPLLLEQAQWVTVAKAKRPKTLSSRGTPVEQPSPKAAHNQPNGWRGRM
jgi:hypothetical protein